MRLVVGGEHEDVLVGADVVGGAVELELALVGLVGERQPHGRTPVVEPRHAHALDGQAEAVELARLRDLRGGQHDLGGEQVARARSSSSPQRPQFPTRDSVCVTVPPSAALRTGRTLDHAAADGPSRAKARQRLGVAAARGQQLVVGAVLDDPAVVEHDDAVGAGGRSGSRWATSSVVRPWPTDAHGPLHPGLGGQVEVGGGLVEQQDRPGRRAGPGPGRSAGAGRPTATGPARSPAGR